MSDREPEPGFTTDATVVRVVDADTIDVEIRRIIRVRLSHPNPDNLDFNAPEKNTTEGEAAINYLNRVFASLGSRVRLFVPAKHPDIFLDFNSFNRIIGEVWTHGIRLTQMLLDKNHAKLSKRGQYDSDVGDSSSNDSAKKTG